jgi:hypothetical protein
MGDIWAHRLPFYLAKWGVPYLLRPGWETRSRRSGGFNSLKGIGIHHDASSKGGSADNAYRWSCFSTETPPIGNGSLGRDGTFQLWAAGAANTMGLGGALRVSRGTINLNDGNATMFAIEAGNNGIGEPWTAAQIDSYPLLCAAVLDWASHETPGPAMSVNDVFAHWEYCQPSCPGRKIDPAGPSPWLPSSKGAPKFPNVWDMDKFRASVSAVMAPKPQPTPEEDDMVIYAFTDIANTWSQEGIHLSPEAYTELVARGARVVTSKPHPQHLKSLLYVSGLNTSDLTPR